MPTSETPSPLSPPQYSPASPNAPAREDAGAGVEGDVGGAAGGGGHAGQAGKATLSRELSDFLVELSIAMQKHAIYPQGHPLLVAAVDGVMNKLALLLVDRNSLSLGIARRQLIIEGVATDPDHPLLKELAGRLHKHSLGAIRISQGFSREELGDALATVAVDPGRTEKPLGEDADALSERWANVRLYPLNYERLQLLYEGTDDEGEARIKRSGNLRAAQLWVGMARAAMMLDEDAELDDKALNPLVVAEAIDKRQPGGEAAYDQVIVGYLLQIADELKKQGGTPEQVELQRRISDLVRQLSPETLKKLLQMGGDQAQRRQFLLNASQGMTVEAVLDLVKAASSEGRQTISHSMMRLFTKLARYANSDSDAVRRATAEASVREQMQKLVSEWDLDDPNPTAYGRVLHRMARTRVGAPVASTPYTEIEPERILQMGFELSAGGPRFDNALDAMLNSARFEIVLDLLDRAPDQEFADHAWSYLDSHDVLWSALGEARIDLGVITRLVRRKRVSAIDPILDTVERTKDSRVREDLLETLLELGDEIGPYIVRRLDTARADLRRDLFLLLGKLKRIPPDFDGSHFLLHTDAPVRREAIRLLLKYVETREQAIVAGVTDTDERAVFYGLSAAQEGGCPTRAIAIIRQRIDAQSLDGSLMTLAIRVLAASDSGAMPVLRGQGRTSQMLRSADLEQSAANNGKKTLDWLIGRVAQRSRFLRQWKLQPKSAEMLAALGALSAYWINEPTVQQIVALALKNGDPDLKKAMAAPRTSGRFKPMAE